MSTLIGELLQTEVAVEGECVALLLHDGVGLQAHAYARAAQRGIAAHVRHYGADSQSTIGILVDPAVGQKRPPA